MITATQIVTALLSLYPHMSGHNRQCIIDRRSQIESVLQEAQRTYPDMPVEMFATVGFLETHLGCDINEGGNWGAPISATRRHVAGTPMQAAGVLWRSYERCHTWEGAMRRFRTGLCHPTTTGTHYSRVGMRIANRLRIKIERLENQSD